MIMPTQRRCHRCREPYTGGCAEYGPPTCDNCLRAIAIAIEEDWPCQWCGKHYDAHDDAPGLAVPRMPCLGLKAHYVPAARGMSVFARPGPPQWTDADEVAAKLLVSTVDREIRRTCRELLGRVLEALDGEMDRLDQTREERAEAGGLGGPER